MYGIRISQHPVIISNYSINKFCRPASTLALCVVLLSAQEINARITTKMRPRWMGLGASREWIIASRNMWTRREGKIKLLSMEILSLFKIAFLSVSRVIQLNATSRRVKALKSKNTKRENFNAFDKWREFLSVFHAFNACLGWVWILRQVFLLLVILPRASVM